MNLRVDLILESEKRSGSLVSNKGALRIVAVIVPIVALLWVALQLLGVHQLKVDTDSLKASAESVKPQQEKAKAMAAGFQGNRDIQAEFTGWQRSRLLWHQQLYGVLCGTPTNVQLQTLTVSQTLQLTNDTPTRAFAMTLGGRGNGAEIEADVKRLQAYLGSGPVYTGLTSRVTIPVYGADMDPKAKREDRVFQILCQYHERLFK